MPLPASISNEKVEALFPNASHIVSVSLTKPRKNQFATGEVCCAFVEFDSEEHCTEALESTSENIEVEGMKCRVQRAMEKVEMIKVQVGSRVHRGNNFSLDMVLHVAVKWSSFCRFFKSP